MCMFWQLQVVVEGTLPSLRDAMSRGKSSHTSEGHISSWNIFLSSTGLAVVLLSLSSFLEAVDGIKKATAFATAWVPEQHMAEQQQQLRDLVNEKKILASSMSASQDAVDGHSNQSYNPIETISSWNEATAPFKPYTSMFSFPAADWKRKDDEDMAETGKVLRVYVYDSLPVRYTESVLTCIFELSGVHNSTAFSSKSTKMADVAILRLFETYPGRVYDASVADIFVVPYAHTAHCYCADGWEKSCGQVDDADINQVFGSLQFYNSSTAARHLFVLSGVQYFVNNRLMQQPLKLLGGNLSPEEVVKKSRGTIVIPYLNDRAVFQKVFTAPESWWTRPRRYAFSFVYGPSNTRNAGYDPRKIRKHFRANWLRRNRTELAGLPVYLKALDQVSSAPGDAVLMAFDRYQDSTFCPILAGDSCQQARFFDVMLSGCIPVVLSFSSTDILSKHKHSWAENLTSWYREGGETTAAVYPFHSSLVDFGIDYDKCVLAVPAKVQRDVRKLFNVMETIILHHPAKLRKLQTNLKRCAMRTTFGMGINAHKYDDAFAQTIRMIRYYLDGMENNNVVPTR